MDNKEPVFQSKGEIETYSGTLINVFAPEEELIHLEDIAHSLSLQCRYAGHCNKFYSVAEHSVMVSRKVREDGGSLNEILGGLLHDGSEAYLTDVCTPVKSMLTNYKAIERDVTFEVFGKFGIPYELMDSKLIHFADKYLLRQEAHWIIKSGGKYWIEVLKNPLEPRLKKYKPKHYYPFTAKHFFLKEYYDILSELNPKTETTIKRIKHTLLFWYGRLLHI